MSLANYGDLQGAIGDWLYRKTDSALTLRAPDLIQLFESDFVVDPEMRTLEMQETDTALISSSSVSLPDSFIEMTALKVIGEPLGIADQPLDYVTPARASVLDSNSQHGNGPGIAKYYTVRSGRIFIIPQRFAPTGASLEMDYTSFTPLAQAQGGVNWLLSKYPNLYLYGSLMQAAAYVDDKETVAFWKSGRDEVMSKLASSARKRKLGASPLVMTPSMGFRR